MQAINRWSNFGKFVGKHVQMLLLASIAVGVLLSVVEVVFGFLIQSFLISMGVISPNVASLPGWIPQGFKANIIWLTGFAVLRAGTQWFKVYGNSLTLEAFSHHLRRMIARWALLSPKSNTSQVVTFLTDRVPSSAAWVTGLQNAAIHVFSLSLLLFYLFKTAFTVALLGLLALVFAGALLKHFNRRVTKAGDALSRNSSTISEKLLDSLKNLHLLKVCRTETYELRSIRNALDQYFSVSKTFFAVKALKFAAPQLIGVFVIVLISIYNRSHSTMSAGAFVSFVYLFIRVSQTASDLSSTLSVFRMYQSQWDELHQWWLTQGSLVPASAEEIKPTKPRTELKPASWNLQNVDFSYDHRSVLKNFSLEVKPGQLVVITGPSGIGKSTLLDLVSGIRGPNSGQVQVDQSQRKAQDIRFGYVGPEPHVIAGSIRENLVYGLGFEVNEAEILDSLKKAHCSEFLTDLPSDLERVISDRGEGLSAGQKQRLSLARALLRRPEALLLDEPTANLDQASEQAVVETLKTMKGQLTIVAVTHRKALLSIADQVIEL